MTKFYKKGYPRPQPVREPFFSLNRERNSRFDPQKEGVKCGRQNGFEDRRIIVPFPYENPAGEIGVQDECNVVRYFRSQSFEPHEGKKILLSFEGLDYRTELRVNGIHMGAHEGGYTRFTFDITEALKKTGDQLVCRTEDIYSTVQPRGKQRWLKQNYDCWYTQTTGIWKDVWVEGTDSSYLTALYLTPFYDENSPEIDYEPNLWKDSSDSFEIETIITLKNSTIYSGKDKVIENAFFKKILLANDEIKWKARYWCPKSPNLYDVCTRIYKNGRVTDEVGSYFGLWKISTDFGRVKLNNTGFYLKTALDQGYWESSLLTPPDEEALILDTKKILEYGYNGVKKRRKIEDERFYYWAGVHGPTVWCEAPSFYEFDHRVIECVTKERVDIVKQRYNHPSIITWVPFNES